MTTKFGNVTRGHDKMVVEVDNVIHFEFSLNVTLSVFVVL